MNERHDRWRLESRKTGSDAGLSFYVEFERRLSHHVGANEITMMPQSMPGEPLFTERLRLEYLDVSHAHALLAYVARNDEHVRPWMPTHPPKETTEASIRDAIERAQIGRSRGELVRFVAFERDGDDIVGSIDLLSILRGIVQSAMLGYSIDATREGRGYATEGARAVVRYAFDERTERPRSSKARFRRRRVCA